MKKAIHLLELEIARLWEVVEKLHKDRFFDSAVNHIHEIRQLRKAVRLLEEGAS